MAISTYLSIVTLNVNRQNALIKSHGVAEWIKNKICLHILCLQEIHLKSKDTERLKVRAQKKVFYENGNEKKAGIAVLVLDKVLVTQSRLTLCNPKDCSPPGSSFHGILQARILEWVVFSRGSSQPRDQTHISYISCTGRWVLYH